MRLIFLGTAGLAPTPTRDANHYLVTDDEGSTSIQVDVSGSTYFHLRQIGMEPPSLSAVILTHHHADHVSGFPAFAQALYLQPQRVTLPVYGPPETLKVVDMLCRTLHVETSGEALDIQWNEMALGEEPVEFTVDGAIKVRAIPSAHPMLCAALKFEQLATGATLVSSSDSYYNPALVPLAAGCDLLIHDCFGPQSVCEGLPPNHAAAEQVAQTANDAQAGALMPMHVVEPHFPSAMRILTEQAACPVLEPRDKAPIRIRPGQPARYEDA